MKPGLEASSLVRRELGVIRDPYVKKYNLYFVTCFWLSIRLCTLSLLTNLKATINTKPLYV